MYTPLSFNPETSGGLGTVDRFLEVGFGSSRQNPHCTKLKGILFGDVGIQKSSDPGGEPGS